MSEGLQKMVVAMMSAASVSSNDDDAIRAVVLALMRELRDAGLTSQGWR